LNAKYIFGEKPLPVDPHLFELVYDKDILIYRYTQYLPRAILVFDAETVPDRNAVLQRVRSGEFDPRRSVLLEKSANPLPDAKAGGDGTVRVLSYEPDAVTLEASASRPGYLLLLDTYFPGWSATVNGQPAEILRADYNFRAVAVPAGKATVNFSYRPTSLRIGLWLCATGMAILGAALVLPGKPKPLAGN